MVQVAIYTEGKRELLGCVEGRGDEIAVEPFARSWRRDPHDNRHDLYEIVSGPLIDGYRDAESFVAALPGLLPGRAVVVPDGTPAGECWPGHANDDDGEENWAPWAGPGAGQPPMG